MGNLLVVKVHAANIHDTMSGCHVYQAAKSKYPTIEGACVDEGYKGTFVKFVHAKYDDKVDVSEKIKPKQWEILPNAGKCIECGKCEKKCPQSIPIRESLKATKKRMEPFWYKALISIIKRFS